MSTHTFYTVFMTAAVCCWRWTSAEHQPDVVGPKGEFEKSVSNMVRDEGLSWDVAEMLVAAKALHSTSNAPPERLFEALRTLEDIQRYAVSLLDSTYDDFLDMYPAWRMYCLSRDPAQRDVFFRDYKVLLDRFTSGQRDLIEYMGLLVMLQKALLPSNAYTDPENRILPSADTAAMLENMDT